MSKSNNQWIVYDEYRFTSKEFPKTMVLVCGPTDETTARAEWERGTDKTPRIKFSGNGVRQPGWLRVIQEDPEFKNVDLRERLGLPKS